MPLQDIEELVLESIRGTDRLVRVVVSDQGLNDGGLEAEARSLAVEVPGAGRAVRLSAESVARSRAAGLEDALLPSGDGGESDSLHNAWERLVRDAQGVHLLRVCGESAEAVLSGFDWHAHRPWTVVLAEEACADRLSLHESMQESGYEFAGTLGGERVYVALEHADLFAQVSEASALRPRHSAAPGEVELLRMQLAGARRYEAQTRRDANARVRALKADSRARHGDTGVMPGEQVAVGSIAWRVALGLQRASAKVPPPARRFAKRALRAAWWVVTPHRYGERLQYLRARQAARIEHDDAAVRELPPSGPRGSEYGDWIARSETRSPLAKAVQRGQPLASFLLRAESGNLEGLIRTIRTVQKQSHASWELIVCNADANARGSEALRSLAKRDARIRLDAERAVALASATSDATAEFIAVLEAGDHVASHAVNELASVVARHPGVQVAYSDEDSLDAEGRRAHPVFKPGWSPDLLYAFNYFGRLSFLRRRLVERAGGFKAEAGAAQEWDLVLRCSDTTQEIIRIPKVLCHRPSGSSNERPAAGSQEAADHRDTLRRHWRRHGFDATVHTRPDGTQRAIWSTEALPLVSVVIPTKDKVHLLRTTVQGLLDGTDYASMEIIIVDTGSGEAQTQAYYDELKAHANVRVVRFEKRFNYSAACNYGAACARGDLFLFLNNDIEIVERQWLAEMVCFAQRPGVGVVGTRLNYPSGELQHGGVGIGPHLCALMYRSADEAQWGLLGSADHPRNWLAIMGACQLVRRDVFQRVGGFDESYLVAMSDVALCLQIWKLGFRTAYVPQAHLVHHEGATRGKSNPEDDIRRIADDIRLLGIDEDPYLHPEIDGHEATPTLRGEGRPGPRETLAWNIETFGSLGAHVASFDLCADHQCLALAELPREDVLWLPQEARLVVDKWSAARWCIDLLRRRADLRRQYPRALTEGAQGEFLQWLRDRAAQEEGLAPTGVAAVEALISSGGLSLRARQAFLRADFRDQAPDGLLPTGRAQLFRWFMRTGRIEAGLRLEEVWWLLWRTSEQPAQELMKAWRFTPAWQRLYPDADTVFGAHAFSAWFAATFRTSGPWLDVANWPLESSAAIQIRQAYCAREHWRARFPDALGDERQAVELIMWLRSEGSGLPSSVRQWCGAVDAEAVARELTSAGINVIGHFCYPSGLRVSVEALVGGMRKVGIRTSVRDIQTDLLDEPLHASFDGKEVFDVSLIHSQPEPFFDVVYERADLAERQPRTYKIAYWYWEFDSIPESWMRQAAQVDEVWTATEFVAKGLRKRLPMPVRTLFPGVRLAKFTRRPRTYFGLQADRFTFLFTFHMMSIMERKNPLGLIRAFRSAFKPGEAVSLVLKTSFGDRHPAQMQELRDAVKDHNIEIIDAVYGQDEVLSLMDSCDAYVSLHRSEGLGLTLAEAMLMAKPVVATNYSGNVDFMDESNSLLVPYTLKKLGRPIPPYDAESEWAEPSLEDAATAMRRIFDDQAWARELGQRAQTSALERLSLESAGRNVARRLEEIRAERASRGT